jgi:hypothetical protein
MVLSLNSITDASTLSPTERTKLQHKILITISETLITIPLVLFIILLNYVQAICRPQQTKVSSTTSARKRFATYLRPFSAWWVPRGWGRHRWAGRLQRLLADGLNASLWVGCTKRQRYAGTDVHILVRCPGRLPKQSREPDV